ncbi:stage III sporulation protein AC [Paenisporosarcina cavernae]|uniref:Stage III sporulation protein AC n=1 Tax=Paenisporosarcina cavernae TaxID=2320858 RepID=A0A385YV26_9BACL|nr:stage III sporulation protein AC [Paenisporosarcina cavernae]AYC29548.1 stage III sporulation protein AC [Paenisporosarcina cavernae]
MEFTDILRIATVGIILAFLHLFFEQTGKKEFTFFLFVFGYLYMAAEMFRFLAIFFDDLQTFFHLFDKDN